eukprot:235961_1
MSNRNSTTGRSLWNPTSVNIRPDMPQQTQTQRRPQLPVTGPNALRPENVQPMQVRSAGYPTNDMSIHLEMSQQTQRQQPLSLPVTGSNGLRPENAQSMQIRPAGYPTNDMRIRPDMIQQTSALQAHMQAPRNLPRIPPNGLRPENVQPMQVRPARYPTNDMRIRPDMTQQTHAQPPPMHPSGQRSENTQSVQTRPAGLYPDLPKPPFPLLPMMPGLPVPNFPAPLQRIRQTIQNRSIPPIQTLRNQNSENFGQLPLRSPIPSPLTSPVSLPQPKPAALTDEEFIRNMEVKARSRKGVRCEEWSEESIRRRLSRIMELTDLMESTLSGARESKSSPPDIISKLESWKAEIEALTSLFNAPDASEKYARFKYTLRKKRKRRRWRHRQSLARKAAKNTENVTETEISSISERSSEEANKTLSDATTDNSNENASERHAQAPSATIPDEKRLFDEYNKANKDLDSLIRIRREWDTYIVESGGSRIPQHPVVPSAPSNAICASYLDPNMTGPGR